MITEENLNDPIFMERLKFIGPPLDVFKAWTNISEIVSEKFQAYYDTVPTNDVVNNKIEYIHKNIKTVNWDEEWLDDLEYFVPNGEKERPARFFKESRFEQWQLVRHASPHQMQFLFVPHQIFFYSTDLLQIVDCYKHRKARIEKDNRKIMESWHDKLTHLGMWRDFGMQYLRYTKLPSNYTKESIQRDVENFWKKPARGNVATIGPPTTIDTHAPVRALVTNEYITPQIATTDKLVRMRQFIRTLGIEDFKEKTNVMHIIEKSSRIKISTGTVEELFEAYNRNRIELLDWTDTSLMCLQLKICSDFSCECSVCTFMRDGTYNQNDPNDSVLCLGTPERVVINLLDDTP